MSLVPYALRPKGVLRRFVMRRGVVGGSPFLRPIAMLLVGQGEYLRARALRQGFFLGNRYWRIIGVALFAQEARKLLLTKPPERIAVERIRAGGRVQVSVTAPRLDLSRRERRAELERLRADATQLVASSKRRS